MRLLAAESLRFMKEIINPGVTLRFTNEVVISNSRKYPVSIEVRKLELFIDSCIKIFLDNFVFGDDNEKKKD